MSNKHPNSKTNRLEINKQSQLAKSPIPNPTKPKPNPKTPKIPLTKPKPNPRTPKPVPKPYPQPTPDKIPQPDPKIPQPDPPFPFPEPDPLPQPLLQPPTMAYTPWDMKRKLLARQQWCPFDLVVAYVNRIRSLQFSVKTNRDDIRSEWIKLAKAAPFSSTVRFPEDLLWVHLNNEHLQRIVMHILRACDLPDRAMNKEHVVVDINDQKRAFDISVAELASVFDSLALETLNRHGVYDRDSFESAFELTWA